MRTLFDQLKTSLAPRYELERELGSGGMAAVYLAHEVAHGRRVAVKVLHPALAGAVGQDRFLQEIRFASRLSHPHILPLLDSGSAGMDDRTLPYYVMPFVPGESLRARLEREKQLPVPDAVAIARDVALALAYAHGQGVIHRDIKPENILLAGSEAVVADFGIARAIDRAADTDVITSVGLAVGTPAYMSPEQSSGQEVDGRSDIYSLGCVLYEMLGGDPPFTGSSANAIAARHRVDPVLPLRTIRPAISRGLEAATLRALEKVPADRFRTADQLAHALAVPGTAGTPDATAPTVETPALSSPRRSVRSLGAASLVLVAVLALGVALAINRRPPEVPVYTDDPTWAAWRGWTGESFPVFAINDSTFFTTVLGGTAPERFDGARWRPVPLPDSFSLLRYVGTVPGGRLLALRSGTRPTGPVIQYWWVRPGPDGFIPGEAVSTELPDDEARPRWWSDGQDLVLWLDAIRHLADSILVREPTGTTGGIGLIWGAAGQRFAIPSAGHPLLEFDGVNWNPTAPGDGLEGSPTYRAGATFPDGATVVLGSECTPLPSCRPLLLQQDTTLSLWRRVPIPRAAGIPVSWQPDTSSACMFSRFELSDVAGQGRGDYYIWGAWTTCYDGLEQRGTIGCPPRQPCTWHVRDGSVVPVPELEGRVVQSIGFQRGVPYALLDDGTLWQNAGNRWRPATRVPGLPVRMIGASPQLIVRLAGSDLRYEPGQADRESPFTIIPMDSLPASVRQGRTPVRLLARSLTAVLLGADGIVSRSDCRVEERPPTRTGHRRGALRCDPWRTLASDPVRDLVLLPDGTPVGIGSGGRVISWGKESVRREILPSEAGDEDLWGVALSDQGRAVAVGPRMVLERDSAGGWTVLRRISAPATANGRFLVLPGGDLVLAERSIQVWQRQGGDSLPVAVLYRPRLGEPPIGALHALADGRLIAGLANPEDPLLGGRLLVWAAPARANLSQEVRLPMTMDITDLADDGRFLHVVGRGGTIMIPLDSLPFSSPLLPAQP